MVLTIVSAPVEVDTANTARKTIVDIAAGVNDGLRTFRDNSPTNPEVEFVCESYYSVEAGDICADGPEFIPACVGRRTLTALRVPIRPTARV